MGVRLFLIVSVHWIIIFSLQTGSRTDQGSRIFSEPSYLLSQLKAIVITVALLSQKVGSVPDSVILKSDLGVHWESRKGFMIFFTNIRFWISGQWCVFPESLFVLVLVTSTMKIKEAET